MKQFFTEALLPFAAVVTLIVVLTLAIFGRPPSAEETETAASSSTARSVAERPEPAPAAERREVAPSTAAKDQPAPAGLPLGQSQERPMSPAQRDRSMEAMNELLARALRNLSFEKTRGEPDRPAIDPNLPKAVDRLSRAIRAARDARDEKDLERAEAMLREAREEMAKSCGEPSSPLCESAERMKELGY